MNATALLAASGHEPRGTRHEVMDVKLIKKMGRKLKEFLGEFDDCCERNSVVECQLPKLDVEGSNPFARFDVTISVISICPHF